MSNELTPTAKGLLAQLPEKPAFLAELDNRQGTEGLSRVVRPSFVKIVQKQSSDELLAKYAPGTIILTPDNIPLTNPSVEGSAARFVPLMFYTEYCKWSSILLKGVEPMIVERSFDPQSSVAIKSQSQATWSERHPSYPNDDKYNYRYCEHLNYIIKLVEPDLMETDPVLISFVRTGYTVGQRLAKLILSRKAPLYAGVYKLSSRVKEGQGNTWRIYSVENNDAAPWVDDPELFAAFKAAHEQFHEFVRQRILATDYDADVVQEAGDSGRF